LLNNLGVLAYLQRDLERSGNLYEESLLLARKIGSLRQAALAQANLGYITLLQDRVQQAAALLAEGLVLSRQLGDKAQMAMCLEGLAGVAVSEVRAERAARLYGAAERLRRSIGVPLYAGQVADVDRFRHEARHALGNEAYEAACSAGRTLSLDQAVKYALGEQQPAQWTDEARSTSRILTRREQEIVALIARGLTNRQIAAELHIADRTVDTHVGHILSKLELTSRTQVAAWVSAQ